MGVKRILALAGAKMGMSPSATNSRQVLLRFLNEAAEELYDSFDPPGSLDENTFKVNGDQTIALPYFVGEPRAARESDSFIAWHINKMRPRYNQFNWSDAWRNFRLKNTQCLCTTVTNQSVGVITVTAVENPPIVVTVLGTTDTAASISEDITMDALSKNTTNQYLDYSAFRKDRVNTCNVTLSDVDGKLLSVIPNNQIEALFQIFDVSSFPWLAQSTSTRDHYLEILYKKALPYFEDDAQEFPAPKYDIILVNKILQLWSEEQDKTKAAIMYDGKASRSSARKNQNRNRETEDKIALTNNPHDTLLPRIRPGSRRYTWGRGGYYP